MELGLALGILGTVLTFVSLVYAVYVTKRSRREKELMYDLLPPAPMADVVSKESGHSIQILYEAPGRAAETVKSVFVQYLRFTNFGRVPITKSDSAAADPVRIEVDGGRVLDVAVAGTTRDVCRIALEEITYTKTGAAATVSFDFIDFLDGALVQIVTDDRKAVASLKGTVVGMPQGIGKGEPERNAIVFPDRGCVIPLLLQATALVAVPYLYRYFTGSWKNIWLLLLPVAALILPIAVTLPMVTALLKRGTLKFPEHLKPPLWYHDRYFMYEDPRRSRHKRSEPGDTA